MRIFFGILFMFFAAVEIFIIFKLKKRKQKIGVKATAVSFGLFFLLTVIVYLFDLKVSYLIMLLATISLFLDAYVGYYLNYYSKSKVVDRYLHAYGTFALALLFYMIIILLVEEGGSKLFRALFVLFLGNALGAIHETTEFMTDTKRTSRQQTKMQKGLQDTNFDIIFNILGSVAAAAAAYFFMT